MRLPPLIEGRLLRRYKRFLADVELLDGTRVTAHVANTGSLLSCKEPGRPVWLYEASNPKRKYRYSWMLIKPRRALVCVDTSVPNRVVVEGARRQRIAQLAGYDYYRPEVPYNKHSRADLCCYGDDGQGDRRCWVEVKSTTLARKRVAAFPDAVTFRGKKHLLELQAVVAAGQRAMQLFFVQRGDCDRFRPADDIDPDYGAELRRAAANGVELLALQARVTTTSITIKREIPVEL